MLKFFRRALAVGSKEPTIRLAFTEEEWQFIAGCLGSVAQDNAEVIGSFDDPDLDARLEATADQALALAARIIERIRA